MLWRVQKTVDPIMIAYKLITVDAPYWGFGPQIEKYVSKVSPCEQAMPAAGQLQNEMPAMLAKMGKGRCALGVCGLH